MQSIALGLSRVAGVALLAGATALFTAAGSSRAAEPDVALPANDEDKPPGISTATRPSDSGGAVGRQGRPAAAQPPAQLAPGNLRVNRWTTFRKITNFPRGEKAQFVSNVKLSADGSRIAFIGPKGMFTLNPDGTDLRQLSDKAPSLMDITADGNKVAWFEPDNETIFVARSDGGGKAKMPGGLGRLAALRLTADGSKLFVLAPAKSGVFAMPTDGSDVKKVIATADVSKLWELTANDNFWRNIDISDDGSRLVGHFLSNAFTANGNGTNIRRLTEYKDEGVLQRVRISGDGQTIAHYRQQGDKTAYIFHKWDGGTLATFLRPNEESHSLQLSPDGRIAALGAGVRFCHSDGKTYYDALTIGPNYWGNPYNLTMTADFRQGCFSIDGPESTDQGRPHQLVIVDLNPSALNGAPELAEDTAVPRFALADGSTTVTLTARSPEKDPQTLGAVLFRNGERIRDINTWFAMNDAGREGDEKAGDGLFSTNALNVKTFSGKPVEAGPVTLRMHVQRKDWGNLTVVDLEGLEVREPSPPEITGRE